MGDVNRNERDSGRVWSGALLVAVVLLTVFGAMLLAMLDRQPAADEPVAAGPTLDLTPTPSEAQVVTLPSPLPSATMTPLPTAETPITNTPEPIVTSTPEPTATSTPEPTATSTTEPTEVADVGDECTPPAEWAPYTVLGADTLFSLSNRHGVDMEAIKTANCLTSDVLHPGDILYLPPAPSPTTAPPECSGPPADWVPYTIRPGNTMYSLATSRGVTVSDVLRANCLDSARMVAGTQLYLPPTSSTPTLTSTPGTPGDPTPALPPGGVCVISSPAEGSDVVGEVSFRGTADADEFQFFKLEANGPETGGNWASVLDHVVSTPVRDGVLGTVIFYGWVPGGYAFRVVVVDTTSNEVASCYVNINVTVP